MVWFYVVAIVLILGWQLVRRWRIATGKAKEMICPTCAGTGLVRRIKEQE